MNRETGNINEIEFDTRFDSVQSGSNEGSHSSSEFLTPAGGSSNNVGEERNLRTPVPVPAPRLKASGRVLPNVNMDSRRPLRSRSNTSLERNVDDKVETSSLPSTSSKTMDMIVPVYTRSARRDFIDQHELFHRLGIPIGMDQSIGASQRSSRTSDVNIGSAPPPSIQLGFLEKSSSPSGLSQSSAVSGMEWDPSADVNLGNVNYQHRLPSFSNKSVSTSAHSYGFPTLPEISDQETKQTSTYEEQRSEAEASNTVPQDRSQSYRDFVSIEIGLDPRTKFQRSKSELGNHLIVVDRSVQTQPIPNSKGGSSRVTGEKSHDTKPSNFRRGHAPVSSLHLQNHRHPPHSSTGRHSTNPHRCYCSTSTPNESSQETSSGNLSSGLTPTCNFINQLAFSGAPINDQPLADAISAHRQEHIANVKRELRRVQALSQLLCGRAFESDCSSVSLSTSEEQSRNEVSSKPPPPPRPVPPQKPVQHTRSKDCESELSKKSPLTSANSSGRQGQGGEKVDEIMRTVRQLLENLLPGTSNQQHSISASRANSGNPADQSQTAASTKRVGKGKGKCVPVKPPVGYFLQLTNAKFGGKPSARHYNFTSSSDKENEDEESDEEIRASLAKLSIQKVLAENRPQFLINANKRRELLAEVREIRKKRASITRNWIAEHGTDNMSKLEAALPTKGPRLMSAKEMRKQAAAKYLTLPEVQGKKLSRKAQREKETNRLLSSYFSGKLRQGVLKGKVNVDLNRSVIRR